MFCMLGSIFAFRGLSYSVAGRGVVNTGADRSGRSTSNNQFPRKCQKIPRNDLGNGRNTVSRVLFQKRELTGENSLSSASNSVRPAKNSVSSLWHTNNGLRGTHLALSPELCEGQSKLTEFGVWNHALQNRIRTVSEVLRVENWERYPLDHLDYPRNVKETSNMYRCSRNDYRINSFRGRSLYL